VESDPVKWQAYQEATGNRAFSFYQRDQNLRNLDMATAYFTQARLAAVRLGDIQAANTHMLGKVMFEKYSVSDRPAPSFEGAASSWRSPRDREGLREALSLLHEALELSRKSGAVDLGHGLRIVGRVEATLGNQVVGNAYFFQADEFYQDLDERQRINFLIDKARWYAQSRSQHRVVEDLLLQTEDLTITVRSRQMLSVAYMQLAHLYAGYGTSEFPRSRSFLAAALLLWPFAITHRDFVRAVVFFATVGGNAETLPRLASSLARPFDVITAFFSGLTAPLHLKAVQEAVNTILNSTAGNSS
jgi:hypothetical protein